jgi:hypothetical protein
VPRQMFVQILTAIARLRASPVAAWPGGEPRASAGRQARCVSMTAEAVLCAPISDVQRLHN